MKGKIGIFKMKHFFAGIGEIHFLSFLLYLSMSTSPIIGLVIGHEINPINSIIIALSTIWALILICIENIFIETKMTKVFINNWLHNIYREFTCYQYHRALKKSRLGSFCVFAFDERSL